MYTTQRLKKSVSAFETGVVYCIADHKTSGNRVATQELSQLNVRSD